VLTTGKKKHQYTQTNNGKTYSYYRKSLTINGKTRTITAANAKEWTEKAELAKREAKDGIKPDERNLTIKQLSEVFQKDGESYAPKTYQEREYILRLYIVPELGHIKLKALKNIQIRELYDRVIGTNGEGIKKLEHVHKILNRMLNWAVENEIGISRNPISKGLIRTIKHAASRSKREEHQELELSYEDAILLLEEVKGKPAWIIFHMQMLHGLRIGEALGMTWENIDLEHNTITVNQQLQDISMKLRKGTRFETDSYQIKTIPKTVRSERNVPLQSPTKKMLLRTAASERNGYVFKGQDGKSVTYGNFRKRHFYPVIRALDLKLKTHDLRTFFGSWHLGVNKTDIMTVSKWMGHRDPRVTLSTYAKVIEELEKEQKYDIGNALVPNAV
jgi:integrase